MVELTKVLMMNQIYSFGNYPTFGSVNSSEQDFFKKLQLGKEKALRLFQKNYSSNPALLFEITTAIEEKELSFLENPPKVRVPTEKNLKNFLIKAGIDGLRRYRLKKDNTIEHKKYIKTLSPNADIDGDVFFRVGVTEEAFNTVLDELPDKQRKILKLFYYKNLSIKQIMQQLNARESAVKMHLTRGRRALKEALTKK